MQINWFIHQKEHKHKSCPMHWQAHSCPCKQNNSVWTSLILHVSTLMHVCRQIPVIGNHYVNEIYTLRDEICMNICKKTLD